MDAGLLLAYGVIFLFAITPIYAASYAALRTPKASRKARSALADSDDEDDEGDDDHQPVVESLSSEEAWRLPIVGSLVLGTLYLAIKFLDKVWVNRLLGAYFSMAGVLVSAKTGSLIFHKATKAAKLSSPDKYKILVTRKSQEVFRAKLDTADVVFGVLATLLCAFYSATYNWIACNAIALSFAFNAIRWLSLDSFRTGIIVLLTLLVYDITWVFGGDVMVTVAKSFEAPIKVVFPKNFVEVALYQIQSMRSLGTLNDFNGVLKALKSGVSGAPHLKMTMLGLGDIVVPGLFVSLALAFDMKMAAAKAPGAKLTRRSPLSQWERPYFRATMIAYVVGLSVTIGVMHFAKAAQPALLYLSPACVLAVLITASARNELKELWSYTTNDDDDQESKPKSNGTTGEPDHGKSSPETKAEDKPSTVESAQDSATEVTSAGDALDGHDEANLAVSGSKGRTKKSKKR